ncbi:MAG TPA: CRISPR-associated endonuclease Cas1 [Planctomycetota bacterium]|nr:CRISPR-associated endonuclease Cas1 [Planctomycetota bacterium]
MDATSSRRDEPIPARMLNEFAYCPRLFWYEHVEGLFRESADTVDGELKHGKFDRRTRRKAAAPEQARRLKDDGVEEGDVLRTTSVDLADDVLGIVAKLDLLEHGPSGSVPVEFKRGRAPEGGPGASVVDVSGWLSGAAAGERPAPRLSCEAWTSAWKADLVQLGAQVLVLEANGHRVPYGVLSYLGNRKRVVVPACEALRELARHAVTAARELVRSGAMPPPLVDDRRCERCSLAPICLPDETASLASPSPQARVAADLDAELPDPLRRIHPARDDQGTLYVNTQGARVAAKGDVLVVKDGDETVGEAALIGLRQVNLMGNVQITTQALQRLMRAEVPVGFFSARGYFYGGVTGLPESNVSLRIAQFRMFGDPCAALPLARAVVAAKIANQRTVLLRNHVDADGAAAETPARDLRRLRDDAAKADSLESLLGHEGAAARAYFGSFASCLKGDETTFDFTHRERRPPTDPVNAMLSFGYALLPKDLAIAAATVGFDPMYGFMHRPRAGRPALALDLMEEFRPLVADSVVLHLVNNRVVGPRDFLRHDGACVLTDAGRKRFLEAYERRKDALVTHPVFGYRLSYNRMFELQARWLARVVQGEVPAYRGFTTR